MALLVRQDVGEVTRPTIEDVLARTEVCGEGLFTATADGPVFSADGTLAVIRTEWLHNLFVKWVNGEEPTCEDVCLVRCQGPCEGRAAALLAAPAPADPEESDE